MEIPPEKFYVMTDSHVEPILPYLASFFIRVDIFNGELCAILCSFYPKLN